MQFMLAWKEGSDIIDIISAWEADFIRSAISLIAANSSQLQEQSSAASGNSSVGCWAGTAFEIDVVADSGLGAGASTASD